MNVLQSDSAQKTQYKQDTLMDMWETSRILAKDA
jgi:hypothetical protein